MDLSPSEQIFIAAIVKLLQKNSIERITVEDILRESGLSRATFYRHFRDKFDLMLCVFRERIDSIYTDDCDLRRSSDRLADLLTFMEHNKEFFRSAASYTGQNSFQELLYREVFRLHCKRYRRIWKEDPGEEIRFSLGFHSAGTTWAVLDWLEKGCPVPGLALARSIMENRPHPVDRTLNRDPVPAT